MMIASNRARLLIAIGCCLLLIPILGIRLQSNASLERFHNRTLNSWPQAHELLVDPAHYFVDARNWLADRAYPIVETSILYKKALFFGLHTPPQHRVSLGDDGFIFLNGAGEDSVNGLLDSICINAHSETLSAQLQRSLASLSDFATLHKLAVDVVIVPTSATLYADHLPLSVPPKYLNACRERATGLSPLMHIQPQAGVHFVFPFAAMKAARDDEGFFPKGNWHASGFSLSVVRNSYLASLNVQTPIDEKLQRGNAPSEIMATYGITLNLPIYFLHNDHVTANRERMTQVTKGVSDLFSTPFFVAHCYENTQPVVSENVLMLSDSYGDLASEVFAGAFRSLTQLGINNLPREHLPQLIERIAHLEHIDRLVLLVQEGGSEQIVDWAKVLAPPSMPPSGDLLSDSPGIY
jgi:hypothetical protein